MDDLTVKLHKTSFSLLVFNLCTENLDFFEATLNSILPT